MNRDFKGVWIPREIWLNDDLSLIEKCLLVEIDSLDNDPERGCFASNEYLSKFIGKSEGRTANIISDLRKRGYLITVFWDGRNRGLRLNRESSIHENVKADFTDSLEQHSRKRESSIHENVNILIQYSNTDNNTLSENENSAREKIITDAGKEIEGNLPPREKMIQKALADARAFFDKWPAMIKTLTEQARIKPEDENFDFFEELENWIRYNGNDLALMTNPGQYIPSKFGRWLQNYRIFKPKPKLNRNGTTQQPTGRRKNKHLISAQDAREIFLELNKDGA